jgi:hypothetical protein
VAVLLVILLNSLCAWAQSPLPALRGIVLTHSGEWRAYFEDPGTGILGAYTVGDVIGGNRIEQIQDEHVVLRQGGEVVRILMGSSPGPEPSAADSVIKDDQQALGSLPSPASPAVMPVYRPNPTGGPTIGNGQPWLDRLGIPPQALSRAIEEAHPVQDPDSDNIKD